MDTGPVMDYGPRRRGYDRNPWSRLLVWYNRLAPLTALVAAYAVAAGFGFEYPARKFERLERADAAQTARLDSLSRDLTALKLQAEADRAAILRRLDFLTRFRCAEMPADQLQYWDVCDNVRAVIRRP